MSRFFTVCIIALFCMLSLSACKKEDPNPELRDPIWKDLSDRAASYEKKREESKVKLTALREKLAKAEPNSMDRKDIQKDIAKTEKALLGATQLARYYKIRADRRKAVDKITAREAMSNQSEWPDKAEYSEYLVNNRLREINLNWNTRVPKLQERLVRKPAKEKAAEKSSSGH